MAGAAVSVRRAKRLLKVLWVAFDRFNRNDGSAMAGFIAFSGLLSLFPFLIFAATLTGILLGGDQSDEIIESLFQIAPEHVALTLEPVVVEVLNKQSGEVLTLSALFAIWVASSAVEALPHRLRPRLRGARPARLHREPGAGDRARVPRRRGRGAARRDDRVQPADPALRRARAALPIPPVFELLHLRLRRRSSSSASCWSCTACCPGRRLHRLPALARGDRHDGALGGAGGRLLDLPDLHADLHGDLRHARRGHHHPDVLLSSPARRSYTEPRSTPR